MEKQNEENLSMSKARKLQRKKDIARMKKMAVLKKIILGIVIVVAVGGIGTAIGYTIYRKGIDVTASSDFSQYLEDDGKIKGVTANELVGLPDYKGIKAALSELEYAEEELEEAIQNELDEAEELSTETDKTVEDGDKINVDYVGTIDGVEFEGGSTGGNGSDVTIGSGSLIDDFEEQLIGSSVGDVVDVNVTFPDDYSNNADLAGKDATFVVNINGIYVAPELTDEYVKEHHSENASTAEEYKQYLRDEKYNENLLNYINTYLLENTTVNSYPDDYMQQLKENRKYQDLSYYAYMNQFASQYGIAGYESFEDYVEMSEFEYDKGLYDMVKDQAKSALLYQAIAELENISVTEEAYKAYLTEEGVTEEEYETQVETYGKGYLMQSYTRMSVLEYLKDFVTVE